MRVVGLGTAVAPSHRQTIRRIASSITCDDPSLHGWLEEYARTQESRLAQELGLLVQWLEPGASVVDVGSTPPILTLALRERGYRVSAVDLEPERFASGLEEAGLPSYACNVEIEPIPLPDESADAVLFNEVFEHLRIDIPRTLRELARILRRDGRLFLSTPDFPSGGSLLRLVRTGRLGPDITEEYAERASLGHMGHVRLYTPREVMDAVEAVGLQSVALYYRHPLDAAKGAVRETAVNLIVRLLPKLGHTFSLVCRRV